MSKPAAVLDVPTFGRVAIRRHALDRMEERGITLDDLCRVLLGDARKLTAAQTLAARGAVRVTFGDVCIVVSADGGLTIVSLWWAREAA